MLSAHSAVCGTACVLSHGAVETDRRGIRHITLFKEETRLRRVLESPEKLLWKG